MERYHIFKLGLAILFYAAYCIRPMMVNCLKIDDAVGSTNNETKNFIDEDYVYYQGVQGKPGVDFPVLSHIPRTTFNCRNVDSGYYADLETDCQVFHICEEGKKISFLCPNGTIFQQSELICEWWFKVDCNNSPSLYEESAEQLREENARRKSSRRVVQNHGAVMRTEEHSSVSVSQNSRSFDVNRASKKVSDNGRRENRINNHAPSYRTSPEEDLTRASSSDFYRNRGTTNKPAPFSTSSPSERKTVQDYDYQDYEDQPRKTSFRNQNRKPVPFRKNIDRRNQEDRKANRGNGFQQQNQNRETSSGFEEPKPVSFRNNNEYNSNFEQSGRNGFQQQTRFDNQNQQNFDEEEPVSVGDQQSSDNGFQQNNQNDDGSGSNGVSQPIPLSVTESSNFNQFRNREHKPVSGFQQNGRFSNSRTTTDRNNYNNRQSNFHNSEETNRNTQQKLVSRNQNTGFTNNFNAGRSNQQFDSQKPVSRTGFQQSNKETSDSNQRFGSNVANNKPVSDIRRTGFQHESSFNTHNFNAGSTTERNVYNQRFSNRGTGSEPVSGIQQETESSEDKPDIQNRIFQQIRNFNEEFISDDKERKHKADEDLLIEATSSRTNLQQSTNVVPTTFHEDLTSTSRTLQPIPLSSGLLDQNDETATVSTTTEFHYHREFKCNFTHPTRKRVVPSSTVNVNQEAATTEQPTTPHEDLISTTNNFQQSTSRTLEPLPLNSGFLDRNDETTTTVPTTTEFHYHREFKCNLTHPTRKKVVPTTTASPILNQEAAETEQPTTPHEDLISTTTSFQQSTSRTLEPLPLNSGFLDQDDEVTTTVSTTTEFHYHREFKCNFTHPNRKVVPSANEQSQPVALSSVSQNQNKKVESSVDGKDGTIKAKSTVPLTRNDIVNRRLEPSESDEAQITEESASFYKNSFNRIDQDIKSSTTNPHPNHRETYSELKEPKHYSNKILSAISSVTPQYLTTQPINSGRPFIGSQVGSTLKKDTTGTTTRPYFTTTQTPTTSLFNIGTTGTVFTTRSTERTVKKDCFGKVIHPAPFSTAVPLSPIKLSAPTSGTTLPAQESTKTVDHATVYGKFAKSSATIPPNGKISLTLSKTLSGPPIASPPNTKTSAEILSTSDSFNGGTPQVRFSGKVYSSTSKTPGVEIRVHGNSKTTPTSLNSFSTTPKPRGKSLNFGGVSPTSINALSTTSKSVGTVSERVPTSFSSTTPQPLSINDVSPDGFKSFSTTPRPFSLSTTPSSRFNYFTTTPNEEVDTTTPTSNPFGTTFAVTTTDAPTTTAVDFDSFSTTSTAKSSVSGFYVTKNGRTSLLGDIARPRPFDLPPEPDFRGRAVFTTTQNPDQPEPTIPTYKISSASPFRVPTLEPTEPTPLTSKSVLPSNFENVDSMINALAEMANQNDGPRPGLVIPPSAGPQTLHTLAVYFANALDGIASDKEDEDEDADGDEENLTARELEKKRLTDLLTRMTMDRYNELFSEEKEDGETTTVSSRSQNVDEDLEGQHSKGPAATPKVRQLARVFTQALSSYLDDPLTFKKVLEEIRPTEPPATEKDETTDGDDELLNFSDADSKSSFPPFFPTLPSARPTWGYLIAYNTSKTVDVKNSINLEENLQGADSQSFVSQFNKLQNDNKETTTKSSIQFPDDHWTTSPGVTKLWSSAFTFDPASINENFGTTTESIATTTEQDTEAPEVREIQYELRALPQLELNSTQVHGILIDFMNTSKSDYDSRLQRILRKLNTTEEEFLAKMKEIEGNPLTRRLILLLISECGTNATAEVDTQAVPVHTLLSRTIEKNRELLETSSSIASLASRHRVEEQAAKSSSLTEVVDPSLDEDSQDARALQLLNSLYTIASRFGK